mgnify:CR=1 FL=1
MIYDVYATKINPSDYNRKPFKERSHKRGVGYINFMNLYRDIKKNGIKYPVLMESVKGKAYVTIGMQRVAIADELKLDLVDAVVYSTNGKVKINGVPIKELNDIVKIYGESIIGEPVFLGIINAITRTHKHNSSSIGD